jgi:hypothetical protein
VAVSETLSPLLSLITLTSSSRQAYTKNLPTFTL